MKFIANAEGIARDAMQNIDPDLVDKYVGIVKFLSINPEAASGIRGKNSHEIGSEEYIRKQVGVFLQSRDKKRPNPPTTVPDVMVSVILVTYFGIAEADAERVKREHLLCMGAENMVGDLLERYLASIMEPKGWIWCSGAMVKAVDFIKPPATDDDVCSGSINPDTNLGGNLSTMREVFHGKATSYNFNRLQKRSGSLGGQPGLLDKGSQQVIGSW